MEQIVPGVWHWTAWREQIGMEVSSYYLAPERVLLDPMLPSGGIEWFSTVGAPEHVLLTNRHHDRDAWRLRDAFGCEVHCVRSGCVELAGRGAVSPFDFGDVLPGGILAHEIGAICPDETALHLPSHRALACADGVVNWPGRDGLTFVPDQLMDDPPATKRGLLEAYRSLLGLDFDVLLLAHGKPLRAGGKRALEHFADAPA